MTLDEIYADFDDLEGEEQLQYLIELGTALKGLPAEFKTEENRVQGCQSNVWLVGQPGAGAPPVINFSADSDAVIVRGIVALLLEIYSGRTAEEILAFPIQAVFDRLQLQRFLSPLRSNGLFSMVQRIKRLAGESLLDPSAGRAPASAPAASAPAASAPAAGKN